MIDFINKIIVRVGEEKADCPHPLMLIHKFQKCPSVE